MSTSYVSDYARAQQRQILWDETRTQAACLLAAGYPKTYVANEVGVHRNTIYAWTEDPEFAAEVDRLSVMQGAASRAERLRIVNRLIRQRVDEEGNITSDKDLLDWLKFAQSETDGAKIDLSKLAELLTGESAGSEAGSSGVGPAQLAPAIEVDAVESGGSSELSSAEPIISGNEQDMDHAV